MVQIKRIVCPVDFSEVSRQAFDRALAVARTRALPYAASLAQHSGGRLTLIHAVELLPVGYDPMAGTSFDVEGYRNAAVAAARKQLQALVATVPAGTGAVETVVGLGNLTRNSCMKPISAGRT